MVYTQVLSVALLATLAYCEPPVQGYNYQPSNNYNNYNAPTNSYLPPNTGYNPPNNYLPPNDGSAGHGSYDHHEHGHENEVPKAYEFGYSVKDAHSGNDYGRQETSDGNEVRGEYRVQLPDGRTQIVTYHADWRSGFHADVRYEGEARYPEPSLNEHHAQNTGYNYNAPSDFSGSLTGFNQGYNPSAAYGAPSYH